MALDIRTLTFAIGITFIIQAIALYLLSIVITKYKGVNTWALGSLMLAVGFIWMAIRNYEPLENISIFLGNTFHILGFIFFISGTKRFLGISDKRLNLFLYLFVFMLVTIYFTFINNNLNARSIFYSLSVPPLLFYNSFLMLKHGKKSIRKTIVFVASIFIIFSFMLLFRSAYLLFVAPAHSFYSPDFVQSFTFMMAISLGLLWTFGLIIVVNQRLNTELAESRNHFELIFETIPDAVTISEIESGLFLNTNNGFSQMSGLSKEDIKGKTVYDVNLWKNPKERKRAIKNIKENGASIMNHEFEFRRKDGSEFTALVSATPINVNEKESILFVIHDITEIKQKEYEIANKNHQLELANTEKDKFFSIIAHDLRGPFSSIIGLSELLADTTSEFSKEQVNELSLSLHRTANSTYHLLENLLEWSSIQRGVKAYFPQPVTIEKVISQTIDGLKNAASNKQIELTVDYEPEITITADSQMLQTIIRNLVLNAIKFTHTGGSVNLSVKQDSDGKTVFEVADSGIGMSPEICSNLFSFDTKNNRIGTNREPSSGLGLYLCKEFVENHGGQLFVKSEEGKGSVFWFKI
jgi:PAS domain S-box-containing protein